LLISAEKIWSLARKRGVNFVMVRGERMHGKGKIPSWHFKTSPEEGASAQRKVQKKKGLRNRRRGDCTSP